MAIIYISTETSSLLAFVCKYWKAIEAYYLLQYKYLLIVLLFLFIIYGHTIYLIDLNLCWPYIDLKSHFRNFKEVFQSSLIFEKYECNNDNLLLLTTSCIFCYEEMTFEMSLLVIFISAFFSSRKMIKKLKKKWKKKF